MLCLGDRVYRDDTKRVFVETNINEREIFESPARRRRSSRPSFHNERNARCALPL
jgi:hypothetical protein